MSYSETGEAYNYFVKSMNDYIRSTFNRSMRIVSTFFQASMPTSCVSNSSFTTVGNLSSSVQLHRQRRHIRVHPALGIL